jgi:hypothetical protein
MSLSEEVSVHAPPPWNLTGRGWVMAYRFPRPFIEQGGFLPTDGSIGEYVGGVGAVMLVDYASSNVGGYRELLFIPGAFRGAAGTFYSITKIYVSTMDSVLWGQRNWSIPKEQADFALTDAPDGVTTARITQGGRYVGEMVLRGRGFGLPVTTGVIPPGLRTLIQYWAGQTFLTAPSAHGRARLAKLEAASFVPALFPDLGQLKPMLTLQIPQFRMTFPVPTRVGEVRR